MKIGIPKEIHPGETRVALIPELATLLRREHHEILVESGAGLASFLDDASYEQAGALIVSDAAALYAQADIIFKVQPPETHPLIQKHEAELPREGSAYIGMLSPVTQAESVMILARRRVTAYALEMVPRITRAQDMDALSSMATVAGYKSVVLAAERAGKMFPLLMTAAGTIMPAVVLVLGAGVAGLQAIATAKRLGARVEAFDPRPAVREQVASLGAVFLDMEVPQDIETAGGYAKEQSEEFLTREQNAIATRLPQSDVVICTAQVFGKRSPVLITAEMVRHMRPGSVIVDLAAEQGGNCALTRAGQTIDCAGVSVIGAINLPASAPLDASKLYARNVTNLFRYLYPPSGNPPDPGDEIVRGACVTRDGAILSELVSDRLAAPAEQGGIR